MTPVRQNWSCPDSTLIMRADATREEWLALRSSGIGGSDIASIVGDGQFEDSTPWFVWNDKVNGADEEIPAKKAKLFDRGHTLEPVVVEKFEQDTGIQTRRAGLHQSKAHPILRASVDRLTGDGGGLECKTTTSHSVRNWRDVYGEGEWPTGWLWQCQHYMAVTGRRHWWLAVLVIDTWELKYERIDFDPEWAEILTAVSEEFWRNHVEPRIEPDVSELTTYQEVLARFPSDDESVLDLSGSTPEGQTVVDLWQTRAVLKADEKALKEQMSDVENNLRTVAASHAEIRVDGRKAFTWKSQDTRRFDSTKFKEDYPELANDYTKTTSGRVLRLTPRAFE